MLKSGHPRGLTIPICFIREARRATPRASGPGSQTEGPKCSFFPHLSGKSQVKPISAYDILFLITESLPSTGSAQPGQEVTPQIIKACFGLTPRGTGHSARGIQYCTTFSNDCIQQIRRSALRPAMGAIGIQRNMKRREAAGKDAPKQLPELKRDDNWFGRLGKAS